MISMIEPEAAHDPDRSVTTRPGIARLGTNGAIA